VCRVDAESQGAVTLPQFGWGDVCHTHTHTHTHTKKNSGVFLKRPLESEAFFQSVLDTKKLCYEWLYRQNIFTDLQGSIY